MVTVTKRDKGLSARSQSVKAAMQAAGTAPSKEDGRVVPLTVRLDEKRYEALRTMAFHERRSMNEIIREALDAVLAKG